MGLSARTLRGKNYISVIISPWKPVYCPSASAEGAIRAAIN